MKSAILAALLTAAAPQGLLAQDDVTPPVSESSSTESIDVGSNVMMTIPLGWQLSRPEGAVVLTAPEGDATMTVITVAETESADEAVARAWALHEPGFARTVLLAQDLPARNGWDGGRVVNYETSPAEQLAIQAIALRKGAGWSVVLFRGAVGTFAKRGGQINQAFDSLRPADYAKESFAGRMAQPLDERRILELKDFARKAMDQLGIPGVGLALIENGRIVYEGGLGVKELGLADPVDEHTRFMVASNTKGMATLLLARLVDENKVSWDQPVTQVYPKFRLGSAETTSQVLVKHLVCACTGLPRKDMEWMLNTAPDTPASATFLQLAATQPTSGFGEVFQYNNLMASAAGYVAAHLIHPELELGAAFDRAMKERIFDPLGMDATTFDNRAAMAGSWAKPHSQALDERIQRVSMQLNEAVAPYRPAGGAWSTAHDMALYVINELSEGVLPSGQHLVSAENLLARRVPNVLVGEDRWYGMGLFDDRSNGVSVIQHGGSLLGYQSNWFAIPDAGVGAVVLTNSDSGNVFAGSFGRRLLEVLYDGKPEADETIASIAQRSEVARAKFREELTYPADPAVLAQIAPRYSHPTLGALVMARDGGKLRMAATSISAEVATRANEDGTHSLVTIEPGGIGTALLVGSSDGKRTLTLNDAQHQYVFVED
jgi:CubicO group peptidase (beta-lactamase class C family)